MLAWANENWTRVWSGGDKGVLMKQEYSENDYVKHMQYMVPFFKDRRYIRIGEKPVFAIYKDGDIPEVERAIEIFRREAKREGLGLYLCRFDVRDQRPEAPEALGFDAAIEFHPFTKSSAAYLANGRRKGTRGRAKSWAIRATNSAYRLFRGNAQPLIKDRDKIYDYVDYIWHDLNESRTDYKTIPGVFPGWDNTSRRQHGGATIFVNSSPEAFGNWVAEKVRRFTPSSDEENLFFINAWNEWAEGNHLEPCERYGLRYLEALSKALSLPVSEALGG
jgi:hypothetical protein